MDKMGHSVLVCKRRLVDHRDFVGTPTSKGSFRDGLRFFNLLRVLDSQGENAGWLTGLARLI